MRAQVYKQNVSLWMKQWNIKESFLQDNKFNNREEYTALTETEQST